MVAVRQKQALLWQAAKHLRGQVRFALVLTRRPDGCRQRGVGAQFHEHDTAQLGEGGVKTPAGCLGHRPEDAGGVGERELRAIQPHQTTSPVEGARMQIRVSQRGERLGEHGFEDGPRHGKAALAGGRVADGTPGQILQVSTQAAVALTDVINQAHEQLGRADFGRAACQGGVRGHDPGEVLSGQQTLELGREDVCIV